MKEATGELNMTVIAVVAIAAVGAFFYAFIWPAIQNRLEANTICNSSPNYVQGNPGEPGYVSCGSVSTTEGAGGAVSTYTCEYVPENGNRTKTVTCTVQDRQAQ